MERHRKRAARRKQGVAAQENDSPRALFLPNIAELTKYGEILIGQYGSIGCIASACDEDRPLAMLLRRKNETFFQLLTRLDQAIEKAYGDGVFTDEINPPPIETHRP